MTSTDTATARSVQIQFDDNTLLPALFGHHDEHLLQIERLLDITLRYRGNYLEIQGPEPSREVADRAIEYLYGRLKGGQEVAQGDVQAAVRMALSGNLADSRIAIRTRKRTITPRSPIQARYLEALGQADLTFGLGPAGTGKTYLAVAMAVSDLIQGKVDRLILSRPAVEAGERLGFLPGDLQEKIDPYLRPLYDALYDMLPGDHVVKRLNGGEIEVAPLAFMRGRTLSRAFIILDEAQNTSAMQMKMFLTRLGEGSRMAVTGDMSQVDLPSGTRSGLADALDVLGNVEGVRIVRFGEGDVVRHGMVTKIVTAYNARDKSLGVAKENQ
ncbi:MAG: phosphate starvation-inducible protein PhoH [Alphaproteobacteria bacterium]|nr:phosphate starvation-inducible protein PhoH [Alphaproteobacteria bacterium]